MFRTRQKLWLLSAAVGVPLVVGAALFFYGAWSYVPPFYNQALTVETVEAARASDELLEQASALANDAYKSGSWRAVFTERQINGWLATDLPKNHGYLLPPDMREPRVSIGEGQIVLACRMGEGDRAPICSMRLDIEVLEANVVAVCLRRVRAGLLPVPMKDILDGISAQATEAEIPLEWRQQRGAPLAIIKLPPERDGESVVTIDKLELHQGEIFVSGTTAPAAKLPLAEHHVPATPASQAASALGRLLGGSKAH